MSSFVCDKCGMTNIDCDKAGFKTPKEIKLEYKLKYLKKNLETTIKALKSISNYKQRNNFRPSEYNLSKLIEANECIISIITIADNALEKIGINNE